MLDICHHYCRNGGGGVQVARFLTIYIEEAHARDEWWLPDSQGGKACISNHTCIEDRLVTAERFVRDFGFDSELVCDSFANDVNDRFAAWPERLFIIQNGVVVYEGGYGPFDYKLAEVKDWLSARFGLRGQTIDRR
jgi:hypothetical protein